MRMPTKGIYSQKTIPKQALKMASFNIVTTTIFATDIFGRRLD